MGDAVRSSLTVPCTPEHAFAAFTEAFGSWWPPEYTWSQRALEAIGIEPGEGGACFELGPYGFHLDWGRVLAWEPPRRLVFSWQIGATRVPEPDPARSSEVEVRFEPDGDDGTRVELVHRDFARHGEEAAGYRAAMGSEQGWDFILRRFAAHLARLEVDDLELRPAPAQRLGQHPPVAPRRVGFQAHQRRGRRMRELPRERVELVEGRPLDVLEERRPGLVRAPGAVQPADVRRRSQRLAVLVRDLAIAEQLGEPRLGHPGPSRLRPVADVDQPPHAGQLELVDQLGRKQPLVADRVQPRHA